MRQAALIAVSCVMLVTACGDDTLDEQDFVDDLTGYQVPEAAARCVYGQIVDDETIMADIKANGVGDDVSSSTANRLENVLTRCLRENDAGRSATGDATTTAPSTTRGD